MNHEVVATLRSLFEKSVYEEYKLTEYAKAVDTCSPYALASEQEFFKMKSNGAYAAEPVNFAWSGYSLGFRDAMIGKQANEGEDIE